MTLRRLLAKPIKKSEVEPVIAEELSAIMTACNPLQVFLFGSAARDEMTESSDLDFLVVVADDVDPRTIKQAYYCRKKTHMWPVDIIFLKQSEFNQKSKIGGVAMVCDQEGFTLFRAKYDQTGEICQSLRP